MCIRDSYNARLSLHQSGKLRVAAGRRNPGIHNLRHRVHQTELFLDLAAGLGHMAGKPLYGFSLFHTHLSSKPFLSIRGRFLRLSLIHI